MKRTATLTLLAFAIIASMVRCQFFACEDIFDCRACAQRGVCSWCTATFNRPGGNKYEIQQAGCFDEGTCGYIGRLDLAFDLGDAAGGGWYESLSIPLDSEECTDVVHSKNFHQCEECVGNSTFAGQWCYTDAMFDGEILASGGSCARGDCLSRTINTIAFNSTAITQASGCGEPYTSVPGDAAPRVVGSVALASVLAGVVALSGIGVRDE